MVRRRKEILAVTLGAASFVPVIAFNTSTKQPVNTDGHYATYVAGYYTGSGSASVGSSTVTINATVSANGASSPFSAPNLTLTGDHFVGTATVSGSTLAVVGRLDGYSQDKHFKGARVLCFYGDGNGHNGRIAGILIP